MKIYVAVLVLLSSFACATSFAQSTANTPFAELDREVKEETWGGNKERLSTAFNAARIKLSERFETELLKYIGQDPEKHYWISIFLEARSYLHGNKPLPYLSLLIKQQALSLLQGKADEESLGHTIELSVTAAVLSEQLKLHPLAISYRNEAERLLTVGC